MRHLIIAIDGPSASGKSTTARLVARELGYTYVDTGAMYRAMTLKVLQQGVDSGDAAAIISLIPSTSIRMHQNGNSLQVVLDSADVTDKIRLPDVTRAASAVSSIREVRELMVDEQRAMGKNGGVVLEGRDIGTIVFPDADLKIFMVANPRERARRRKKELEAQGVQISEEALEQELIERDRKDATRAVSPLRQAEDAIVLDTTNLTIDEQVRFIVEKAKERLG